LAHSKDKRAIELERRVVLSQYLTAIQCSGSMPPQETGLGVDKETMRRTLHEAMSRWQWDKTWGWDKPCGSHRRHCWQIKNPCMKSV
jgi:hypothetical protein